MSDLSVTATADASGTAVATFQLVNSGLVWIVAQISNETTPFRVGATATIRRNGRFIAASSIGSADTAFGPPSVLLRPGEQLTLTWVGLAVGDQAIGTIFYKEQPDTAPMDGNVVV